MAHKQFKIGEYCMGGIIDATINGNHIVLKCLDWTTKEVLRTRTFDSEGVDAEQNIDFWLIDLTSSYYTDKVMQYIKQHTTFKSKEIYGW